MRPRINNNKDIVIKYKDMNKYLTDNKCYGITASFKDNKNIEYLYLMMYRDNKKEPVEAKCTVSIVSKNVLFGTIGDKRISTIREFMNLCRWK